MFCRCISWFVCTFVAVAIATGYSVTDSSTVSESEVTVHQLRFDNLESPTASPVQEAGPSTEAALGWLLDAGEGAVVALVAGDTRLAAHRAVLAARSAVFRRALRDPGVREVTLPDVEGPVLRQLVAYMYTLQTPQLPDTAPQLLAAADRFGLPGLKADCERQLMGRLSVETAAAAAALAVRHDCGSLRRAAVAYIREHVFHVMATQGWADAVRGQPDVWIKVVRLLSESPAETSSPASPDSGTSPYPATQTLSDHSGHTDRETPASAAPSTAAQTPAQTEDEHTSFLRSLSPEEKGRRLIEAAKEGAVGELEALLAAGADVGVRDEEDEDEWTALHWAARQGHEEAARRLLAAGAAVGARDTDQWTPLHCAARRGHAAVVRLLLAAGADHTDGKRDGWTPLHLAAANGHKPAALALLQAGADWDATNEEGNTPLDVARQYGQTLLVNLLLGR